MEEIILKLLATDTFIIQQGTSQLREAFKNPESTRALYQLMVSSSNSEVRQYSALLLRKRYTKGKNWSSLNDHVKAEFKAVLIQALLQEPQKSVKNSITQLIGVIVKHELPHNGWPEVLQFIRQRLESGDLNDKELGMYILSTITEIAPDAYLPHVQTIIELLNATLNSFTDLANPVSFYILETMLHLLPLIEGNQLMINAYHQMLPQVIQIIQSLATVDSDKALKGFELLDGLCECAAPVIAPRLKCLVEMCLFIINNPAFDDDLKINSVHFIGCLVKLKKKAIVKQKLVDSIIDMLFIQMCAKPENEEEEVYFAGEDDKRLITAATQTLDLLALHLPPEKLVTHLLNHIDPALKGTNIYAKKASYLAMAILAEGCSEFIRSKYLQSFLQCICQGITESSSVVRNAALFALGQFSEYLQPDISRFAEEILPILFNFLNQISLEIQQGNKDLPAADRIFYALEIFAENLNEELLPYLPVLMPTLFKILEDSKSSRMRELALSAIGAAANASKEFLLPYFENIITLINQFLVNPSEENACLQAQAVDTLGTLARNIGEENFAPLAMKSLEMSLQLLQSTEDPDLKKSLYGLLASISIVMKQNLSEALPTIVFYLLKSIQSSDGIMACLKGDEFADYLVIDDHSENENDEENIENTDNEEEDESDNDIAGYNVENAYIEEKEEAILALKEIAEHTHEAFAPFLEKSFEEVYKLVNYPQEDIRKAVIDALMQFCINFSKINSGQETQKALSIVIPKFSELIRLDEERGVVMQALDACTELLEQLKSEVFIGAGHKEAMINCITDVMLERTECQDQDDAEGDEGEAEYDELLLECAGQLLVNLGKASTPEDFTHTVKIIFPIFIKRLTKSNSDSQKSYIIGTILECFPSLQDQVKLFVSEFFQIFMNYINDPCDEVRTNAIFGLGELALYGKETAYTHYIQILQVLSNAISKETNANVRDNIIGAIARLIITNPALIPLEQVFPVFINHLPLKEDLSENETVFKCILELYKNGHIILRSHINSLLKVSIELLNDKKTEEATKKLIIEFMKPIQRDFPDEWNSFCSNYSEQNLVELQKILI